MLYNPLRNPIFSYFVLVKTRKVFLSCSKMHVLSIQKQNAAVWQELAIEMKSAIESQIFLEVDFFKVSSVLLWCPSWPTFSLRSA